MTTYTASPSTNFLNPAHHSSDAAAEVDQVAALVPPEPTPNAEPNPTVTAAENVTASGSDSRPAVGPAARLLALPQSGAGLPATLARVDEHLSLLEAARQAQLDELPRIPLDVVTAAHRTTVTRILEQVRVARRLLTEGAYGNCVDCGDQIDPERLELRPWLVSCTGCAAADRP